MRPVGECGGCLGLGAHRRWCPEVIGRQASFLGRLAEDAEDLGDQIGPNVMGAANHCYEASGLLRKAAQEAADAFSVAKLGGLTRDGRKP